MVCTRVRRDNPQALVSALSTVQAPKPCSISLVTCYPVQSLHITEEYLELISMVAVWALPVFSSLT